MRESETTKGERADVYMSPKEMVQLALLLFSVSVYNEQSNL